MFRKFAISCLIVFLVFPLVASTPPFSLFHLSNTYDSEGEIASSVAVADVNGDGKLDIVVANNCSLATETGNCTGAVSVLLGNGDGTFQVAKTYDSGGFRAISIAVADVNGDGKADLVVANNCNSDSNCTNGTLGVLLGNGDGTFQVAQAYGLGGLLAFAAANAVAIADVNGDGKPDLLVTELSSGGAVGVLLGNGDGTFQLSQAYGSGGGTATSLAVADVNGDGKPDVLVGNQCADVACATGSVGVLLGNGDGTFQAVRSYESGGYDALSIGVADVNGDGKPDLLVGNECPSRNNCSPGIVAVLLGNGDGSFRAPQVYTAGFGLTSVAIADLNGDGKPDLVVSSSCVNVSFCGQGLVQVRLGNGDGTFGPQQSYRVITSVNDVAIADVNADGRPDVVVASSCTSLDSCVTGLVTVVIGHKYPTSITIATSASPIFIDQPVTFTAKITSAFGTIPDGETVFFQIGSAQLGTGKTVGGVATFKTTTLRGTNTIAASYPGDSNFQPSSGRVAETVEHFPTTTSLSSIPNPSTSGQIVQFTANVASSAPTAPVGAVVFKNGGAVIGTAAVKSGTAIFRTAKLPVGTFSVTATYTGDSESAASTSTPVSQVVN